MTLRAKKKAKAGSARRNAPATKKKAKVTKAKTQASKTTKTTAKTKTKAKVKAKATAKKKAAAAGKTAKKAAAPTKAAPAKKVAKKKTLPKKAAAPKKAAKPKPMGAARRRQLNKFRSLLLDRQRALMQAYATSKGDTRNTTSDGTEDYIDYAVSSYTREFSLSVTELERKQLQLVEEALRRLNSKDFGRCLNCGTEIPLPRLEVEPWARYCIRCAELEEQGLLEERDFDADDEDDLDDGDDALSPDDEADPALAEDEEEAEV